MSTFKDIVKAFGFLCLLQSVETYVSYLENNNRNKEKKDSLDIENKKKENYYRKINESNKLANEESNRLITWSLSIIGGSILLIISTDYVNPRGWILYSYFLFAIGWTVLAMSIYYGETLTRIYMSGATASDTDTSGIREIGEKVDEYFAKQIKFFRIGIIIFSIWLILFLIWFIISKK